MDDITLPDQDGRSGPDEGEAKKICGDIWDCLKNTKVVDPQLLKQDLMVWRRGSAQLVLKVNPSLNNLSIYCVLVSAVKPSEALYRHLLFYNVRQRRESLGLLEKGDKTYIVLKYTMELELISEEVLQRHIFALQEIADKLDTELVNDFGGSLKFEDWEKLDQGSVDNLLDGLFG